MKEIPLTNCSKMVLVDDEWYGLAKKTWHLDSDGYARHGSEIMHRTIAETPKGMETDHINGNKLDNRKSNLRVCTQHTNQMNRGPQKNNLSGYKGVYFDRIKNKYKAQIQYQNKVIHLGSHNEAIGAARAYDEAAKRYFGEFARLNFPE